MGGSLRRGRPFLILLLFSGCFTIRGGIGLDVPKDEMSVDEFPGAVVLSFDDFYLEWFDQLELFTEYQAKVTFFINDRTDLNEFDEKVRLLANSGHEVGWHGASHRMLNQFNLQSDEGRAGFDRETVHARDELYRRSGIYAGNFAYPYGQYSPETVKRLLPAFDRQRTFSTLESAMTPAEASSARLISSQSIDNLQFTGDTDFQERISKQLDRAAAEGLVFFYTTHQISNRNSWKISRLRLELFLQEASRRGLLFLRFKDLSELHRWAESSR